MKRVVAGTLWTLVFMWVGAYVALHVGVPAIAVFPFALTAGAFVMLDPLHRVWPRAAVASATIRPTTHASTGLARSS